MTNIPTTYAQHDPQAGTQQRVIAALAQLGDGWHTARDIAAAIGRKQLFNSERGVLVRLVADGILASRLVTIQPIQVNRYEYRVVGDLPQIRSKDEK